jgi:hypothetical protein
MHPVCLKSHLALLAVFLIGKIPRQGLRNFDLRNWKDQKLRNNTEAFKTGFKGQKSS